MLIYLHGFRSSPLSFKATWLAQRFEAAGLSDEYACPQLPVSPRDAIMLVRDRYSLGPDDTLIGSSLGGYYATWLAEQTGCRAVLLNPAVFPARDLAMYVGALRTYHDDQPMEWRAEFVDQLLEFELTALTFHQRYLLVAAKGDEVLSWREMTARYAPARTILLEGGDHGLSDFADHAPQVLQFAGFPAQMA